MKVHELLKAQPQDANILLEMPEDVVYIKPDEAEDEE